MSTKSVFAAVAMSGALCLGAVGCSKDDNKEPSAEEQFCTAGKTLQEDIKSLAKLDVIGSGLDGITTKFESIKANVATMKEAGLEVAADEIDALQASIDDLDTAISKLSANLSIDNASAAVDAVAGVAGSASAVYEVYSTTCD